MQDNILDSPPNPCFLLVKLQRNKRFQSHEEKSLVFAVQLTTKPSFVQALVPDRKITNATALFWAFLQM